MKAAVLTGPGELRLEELPVPECGPGDTLIRVRACGICKTDFKCFREGQRDLCLPRILGHEIAGEVVLTGRNVRGLRPGDRVQVSPGVSCGNCRYCRKGQDNLCDGVQILGFSRDGGFSEFLLVPGAGFLQKIPDGVSYGEAALTEPLACAVNMLKALHLSARDRLLVIGAGRLGILMARLALAEGLEEVLVAESDPARLRLAASLGIRVVPVPGGRELRGTLQTETGWEEADAVIPCCPGTIPFMQGLDALGKGGVLGFFSGLSGDAPGTQSIPVRWLNSIHYRELTLTGSYGCGAGDNRRALSLIASGQVPVRDLITRRISLEELPGTLAGAGDRTELAMVLEPWGSEDPREKNGGEKR